MIRSTAILSLAVAALLAATAPARARPAQMMQTDPAASAVVRGDHAQYVVRFDTPVDHRASRLWITRGADTVQQLTPSLDSAPEVLFAGRTALPEGDYALHWEVRSMNGGDVTSGSIPFKVAR